MDVEVKNDFISGIQKMSEEFHLSPAEIKSLLGISLDEKCRAIEAEQAKTEYSLAPVGSEKKMAALKRWIELFLVDVAAASSEEKATNLYANSPADSAAKIEALKKVASFYGVTPETACQSKLNSARYLNEAIRLGFDFMPLGSSIVGPQGKIMLIRNNIPKEVTGLAEIVVKRADITDKKTTFTVGYTKGEWDGYLTYYFPYGRVDEKAINKLQNKW